MKPSKGRVHHFLASNGLLFVPSSSCSVSSFMIFFLFSFLSYEYTTNPTQ
jgi:hypothetical protein